jgi:hypothetical protein
MWQIIIALIIVIFIGVGLARGKTTEKSNPIPEPNKAYAGCIADGKLNRTEIISLLKNLPDNIDKQKLSHGAMCYAVAPFLTKIEYVCPKCGARTLYTKEDEFYSIQHNILQLDSFRRLAAQIKGLNVKLDESRFCAKCSPNIKHPELILNVSYPDEKTAHQVKNFSPDDLRLMIELTEGKVIHQGNQDRETPLLDHKKRLEELFGVPGNNR